MFGDQKDAQKNLKDSTNNLGITIKDTFVSISYAKTNKLITALYMVTDVLDKDEPIRGKLRTLGIGIISDINSTPSNACPKIFEIMSFLDIASTLNIISEMNSSILKKEFNHLDRSIKESMGKTPTFNRQINLTEFFKEEVPITFIGHPKHTRVGVQKGSTLMKALSRVTMSNTSHANLSHNSKDSFNVLKKDRREQIMSIIRLNEEGATITDIKSKATGALALCGEKTLQRELMSMVKDGVLNKIGEKRWSRYFLNNSASTPVL